MFQFRGFTTSICLQHIRLPHSDIYGYNGRLHLPVAFRSLPRPSSSPGAKASPIRPYFASISRNHILHATALLFFNSLNLYYLNTLHLKSIIAFPSLVNELFTCLYPLSIQRQANDHCKYSRRLIIANHSGIEPETINYDWIPQWDDLEKIHFCIL